MLIVPDVQDVYTPLESDVIVPFSEVISATLCFRILFNRIHCALKVLCQPFLISMEGNDFHFRMYLSAVVMTFLFHSTVSSTSRAVIGEYPNNVSE